MLRELGIFEKALWITNRHAPFNVVCVLRMEAAPAPELVRAALSRLQERHPLLRARIVERDKRPFFEALSSPKLLFRTMEREGSESWRRVAEQELSTSHQADRGPLFRVIYLYGDGGGDLLLNFHHTIMDAVSGLNLLDELLRLCTGEDLALSRLEPVEALEAHFPSPYRGPLRWLAGLAYGLAQMGDMLRYQWRNRGKRVPPLHARGSIRIATLVLPEDLVDRLAQRGRRSSLTLNSLLNAALLLAANRHLYAGKPVTMRTFTFADMRPFTQPPTPAEHLGAFISMLGQTVDVAGNQDFWSLAKFLHERIYRALKSGEKFSAPLMSEALLNMITRYKFMRFGAAGLSYSGTVPLQKRYGDIRVTGLHAFISGYDLGPEVSAQARLFQDQIWWDFSYLDTDMDEELAEKLLAEIKTILKKASKE